MRELEDFVLIVLAAVVVACLFALATPAKAQSASLTLDWTSPGDDGNVGTAATYEMRYRSVAPSDTTQAAIATWWTSATPVTGLPAPAIAGTLQSATINGLSMGVTYWIVMRTADEVPNWSLYSNVASKFIPDTVPPAKITDERVR